MKKYSSLDRLRVNPTSVCLFQIDDYSERNSDHPEETYGNEKDRQATDNQ